MVERSEVRDVKDVNEVKEKSARIGPVKNYTDPREEQFELGRQLRRSARSIAANIVEGWAKRNSPAEFKRHLVIAPGEVAETKFWIELTSDEGLIQKKESEELAKEYAKLGFMIDNLWKEWRKL